MSSSIPLTEEDLHDLYLWVDEIPLSKPKRNIARDFSDGMCIAELIKHFFPKLVELHNFTPANSTKQKMANWETLNARVLRKLHFEVPAEEIRDITAAVPGAIERFLRALRTKISQIKNIQEQRMIQAEEQQPPSAVHYPPISLPAHSSGGGAGGRYQGAASAADRPSSAAQSRAAPSDRKLQGPTEIPTSSHGLRQLLEEKDRTILELRESVALLADKVSRLEELTRVKDEKILRYKQQLGR